MLRSLLWLASAHSSAERRIPILTLRESARCGSLDQFLSRCRWVTLPVPTARRRYRRKKLNSFWKSRDRNPQASKDSLIPRVGKGAPGINERSEEHTSELQSLRHLVCRLLLENKNNNHHRQRE